MVQRGCGSSFLLKLLHRFTAFAERFQQEFQCDEPAEPGVLRLIDDTHSATAQLIHDEVMRNSLADHDEMPLAVNDNDVQSISEKTYRRFQINGCCEGLATGGLRGNNSGRHSLGY